MSKIIWGILLFLTVVSLLVVYSAVGSLAFIKGGEPHMYFLKHAALTLTGLAIAWLVSRINYRYLRVLAKPLLVAAVLGLLYTLVFGVEINEARRWIRIPVIGLTFQTSAFAQFALIIYLTATISDMYEGLVKGITGFKDVVLKLFMPAGVIIALILPANLSTAIITAIVVFVILFMGLVPARYLMWGAVLIVVAGAIFILLAIALGMETRLNTWVSRLETFFSGEPSYQTEQALRAMSRGGFVGAGPGKSVYKYFLPHAYSDYVFAIIVEEYGLVAGLAVIAAYVMLFISAIYIFLRTRLRFASFLALGVSSSIVVQAYVHMSVVMGLLPSTGIPLPVISMGGTTQWLSCALFGVLLSVHRFAVDGPMKERVERSPEKSSAEIVGV